MSEPDTEPFKLERLGVVMQAAPSIPEEVEGALNPGCARPRRRAVLVPARGGDARTRA